MDRHEGPFMGSVSRGLTRNVDRRSDGLQFFQ